MTLDTRATFTGAIPENYDRLLGPTLFGGFAELLALCVPAKPPGDVLEIACGTGLVTRGLRRRLDPSVAVVATDLNKPMLDYAAAHVEGRIEFREADAMQLPFADARFGAVVCGFGLMFVPDKPRAFREARRVLGPGGLLVFTVWDGLEHNPIARTGAEVVEALFPGDADDRFRTPYEMADPALLRRLLADAHFEETRIEARQVTVKGSARSIATGQIKGTPRSLLLEKKGASLDDVIDRIAAQLEKIGGADPFQAPAQAVFVEARAA
jgi:SAM-dependent methyltransferase